MWRNGIRCSCWNGAQVFGPQLKRQCPGPEKFGICPLFASCLEENLQIQTYPIERACLLGLVAEIIWQSGVNTLTFHFRMASSNPALKNIGLMTSPCFTPRSMLNVSLPWSEPVSLLWSYHNNVQQQRGTFCFSSASRGGMYSMRSNACGKPKLANHTGTFQSKDLEVKHFNTNASSMPVLGRNPVWSFGCCSSITTRSLL